MSGPRVVPSVRAFLRRLIESFENGDAERRLELLEQRAERRAHDSSSDQRDIDGFGHEGKLNSTDCVTTPPP
jgi:hypothetical protein